MGSRAAVRRKLENEFNCTPVFLSQEVYKRQYRFGVSDVFFGARSSAVHHNASCVDIHA